MALIGHAAAAGNASTHAVTTGFDTTGATLLVAGAVEYGPSSTGALIDSRSNGGWVLLGSYGSAISRVKMYYCLAPTVGSGHTFDYGGTDCYPALAVWAFDGTLTSGAKDKDFGFSNESTGDTTFINCRNPAAGNILPAEDNEVCVYFAGGFWTGAVSVDTGTLLDQFPVVGGVNFGIASAYLIQTTATAINPLFSWSGNANASAAIATFKTTGGGGGAPAKRNYGFVIG